MLGGKWERAEAKFTDAIERSPSVPDYYRDRGDAWTQIGRWRDAVADFDQARAIRPQSLADQVRAASARFAAGTSGARGLCRELAKAPGIGDDPAVARQLLSLFATIPDALEDYSGVLTMGLRLAPVEGGPAGPGGPRRPPLSRRAGPRPASPSSGRSTATKTRSRRRRGPTTPSPSPSSAGPEPAEALRRADDLASKELSALKEAVRNDRSRWVDAVALEHLLSEARAALGTAPSSPAGLQTVHSVWSTPTWRTGPRSAVASSPTA